MSINLYHNQVYFNSKNSKSNSNLLYKKNRCQYQLSMDAIYHCWKSRDQTRFYTISIPTNPTGNSTATRSFEIFQFLAIFSEFSSNSKFNLLYKKNKFRLNYKSTLQSKNVQVIPKYQFRYKSFKLERGKSESEIQIPILVV